MYALPFKNHNKEIYSIYSNPGIISLLAVLFTTRSVFSSEIMSEAKETITFVSSNAKKLEEFVQIMGPETPYQFAHQSIKLPELQGDLDDISKRKCATARRVVKGKVVIEDTSLCFTALEGMPGPYIKWFLERIGNQGLYKLLAGFEDKSAKAVCTFSFADTIGPVHLFKGEATGTIVEPRGPEKFGWDACFQPDGYDRTFAEMSLEEKNLISHRYKALQKFKEFISTYDGFKP